MTTLTPCTTMLEIIFCIIQGLVINLVGVKHKMTVLHENNKCQYTMEKVFNLSTNKGKLPSKSIDTEQNDTDMIKEAIPEGSKDKRDTRQGTEAKMENYNENQLEVPPRNFLSNFKPKSDTIYLKLIPDYHPLSIEQQTFFVRLTEGVYGYNEQIRNEMLKILATDCNVRELVPYLCVFVKETIQCNIVFTDLTLLIYSVRMTKSLLSNSHVELKPHLHHILPAILSCALAKRISKYHYDNHWTLRDFSAYVIGMMCNIYGNDINNITRRVINIYRRPIMDLTKPLTTLYGAIKGLGSLGEETVKHHILPYVPFLGRRLYSVMERKTFYLDDNRQQVTEAKHVRDAILGTVCPILLKTRNVNDGGIQYTNEFGYLGHAMYMQVKNLEKIELDRRQNQIIRYAGYNVPSNNAIRNQNCQTVGFMPLILRS